MRLQVKGGNHFEAEYVTEMVIGTYEVGAGEVGPQCREIEPLASTSEFLYGDYIAGR